MTREEIEKKVNEGFYTFAEKMGWPPQAVGAADKMAFRETCLPLVLEVAGIAWEEGCLMALKTRDDYEHLCDSAWLNESPYKQDVVEKT
jgi:hypothetical protein